MRATLRRRSTLAVATLAVAALALSGCAATTEESASGVDCAPFEAYLGNEGTEVEIYTTIVSPEADSSVVAAQPDRASAATARVATASVERRRRVALICSPYLSVVLVVV